MELRGKKINFLGDSITEGVGANPYENGYVGQFARQTTPSEKARWDLDFCSRVEGMDPDADIVVVFGGTNDFGHGDAPLGEMTDRTVWTFYGACHVLFSSIIEKYPDKPVVIMTPLHRCAELERQPVLKTYVEIIREVAEYYSLPVLDLFATSGIQPLIPVQKELYFADLVHPNEAGHGRIAYKLKRFLENM